jgi:hypothetical protein
VIYHNIEELSVDDLKWENSQKMITKCDILADEVVSILSTLYKMQNLLKLIVGM